MLSLVNTHKLYLYNFILGLSQYIPGVAPGAVLTGAGLYTGEFD